MPLDRTALDWLSAHHATIPSSVELLTVDERRRLVTVGVLTRVVDGAYAFAGFEDTELARCAALCASRPSVTVGGPTAARLWELRRAPRDGVVHVIAPPGARPSSAPWVRAYRTAAITAHDVVERPDGIRTTSPPRTVVDMARFVGADDLASMVEQVIERRMAVESTLVRTARRLATPGRPWARRFLDVMGAREPGAPAESDWELRVFEALRARGVVGLVRQLALELPGYGRARFDISVPELRWAVEVDVHPEHRTIDGAARDNRRDAAAGSRGWVVRRVAERQLTDDFAATVDDLVAAVVRRRDELARLR